MRIYTFSPFGYEGNLISVEVDVRQGLPAYDIVGLADGAVKESRERIKAAIRNSGFDLPSERVLIGLSPADLKKEGASFDLAMALGILCAARKEQGQAEDGLGSGVLVLGELELSGNVRPVRGVRAAVATAKAAGIDKVIVPKECLEEALGVPRVEALAVSSLKDAAAVLEGKAKFVKREAEKEEGERVEFDETLLAEAESVDLSGQYKAARALEIAAAGKHNVLLIGAPGSGKTLLTQSLLPALTPKLTDAEAQSTTRIHSLAGLLPPGTALRKAAPFRTPHPTASLEGMCGGGSQCRPGEISLAHNGTLFLDEAAEFRSTVLQMLRVPLETGRIVLSRLGRTTVYPSRFQLAMAANPCPCGNLGSHGKICLDSAQSVELYWKKFGGPLLDRVPVKVFVEEDPSDSRKISVPEMRARVAKAFEIQRARGAYNDNLTAEEVAEYCKMDPATQKLFDDAVRKNDMSPRMAASAKKVALTIANMDGRTEIRAEDMKESLSYTATRNMLELSMDRKRDETVQETLATAPVPEPSVPREKEEIYADFAERVKEKLGASNQKALDAALAAAKEALDCFPSEERAVIGELLSKKGAKDGASLAKVLEKGTESKNKKRNREEGGRGM